MLTSAWKIVKENLPDLHLSSIFFLGIKQYKRTSIRPLNVTPSNLLNRRNGWGSTRIRAVMLRVKAHLLVFVVSDFWGFVSGDLFTGLVWCLGFAPKKADNEPHAQKFVSADSFEHKKTWLHVSLFTYNPPFFSKMNQIVFRGARTRIRVG